MSVPENPTLIFKLVTLSAASPNDISIEGPELHEKIMIEVITDNFLGYPYIYYLILCDFEPLWVTFFLISRLTNM